MIYIYIYIIQYIYIYIYTYLYILYTCIFFFFFLLLCYYVILHSYFLGVKSEKTTTCRAAVFRPKILHVYGFGLDRDLSF